ncbi:type IV pilus twitching motility protein PilT [Chloroflexota bacterium]
MDILTLLRLAKDNKASDVHLVAYNPPMLRIHGFLDPLFDAPALTENDLREALKQLASSEQIEVFDKKLELDFGFTIAGTGRLRCNVAKQRGTTSLVIRILPLEIPSLKIMQLPDICKELITRPRGLIIVSGPTGSGKSTTLAAMLDYLNHTASHCIVTIEDPIEYIYTNSRCAFTQRELGSDTHSFAEALKHVLRQDPDVILVGEMRDSETADAVLTLAETGHLVLTTGHAPSAYQAVQRVVDLFPPHERALAQTRLASLLIGILCQSLVPRSDKKGRVAAIEIMLGNPAVKSLIRDGKIHQLPNVIRTNYKTGMRLLDQSLVELYRLGEISHDNVMAFCNDPEEIVKLIGSCDNAMPASQYNQ